MFASSTRLPRIALAAFCVVGLSMSVSAGGDDSTPASRKGKESRSAAARDLEAQVKGLTPDQQQQALGFARAQHPELADLLEKLRETNPKEFGKALHDLHRAEQRLSRMAEQNPERFALEISLWKLNSRIRLLTAQMIMEGEIEQEENLKSLLSDRRDLKVRILEFDRARATERLANLDQQLAELQRDPQGDNEKELARLKQSVGKHAKAAKKTRSKQSPAGSVPDDARPKKKTKKDKGEADQAVPD